MSHQNFDTFVQVLNFNKKLLILGLQTTGNKQHIYSYLIKGFCTDIDIFNGPP